MGGRTGVVMVGGSHVKSSNLQGLNISILAFLLIVLLSTGALGGLA